jgi:integrase
MMVLTARFVAAAKPGRNKTGAAVRTEYSDGACPGLHLVVQPTGSKSWAFRFRRRTDRKSVKLTIGKVGEDGLSLAGARAAAAAHRHRLEQGIDPAGVTPVTAVTSKTAGGRGDMIEAVIASFLELHAYRNTRRSSARATEGIFNRIVLPAWRGRTVDSIRKRDVIELVEGVAVDRPVMANRTHAALSRFFRWLCERDILTASPCISVPLPSKETARERVLNDDELRRLWAACEAIGGREGACIKLLILTGQRRSEIAKLRWSEVGGDVLELPSERMKGKQPHMVPLSTQAAAIIASMPQLVPQVPKANGYVFGTRVDHFDRIKRELDKRMGEMPKWVTHDIRRSVASGMARIGVAVPVIEKILAHKSGTFRGIVGVYQRHSFLPEMAVALQRWGDHVERLVGGEPAKVVVLHPGKSA